MTNTQISQIPVADIQADLGHDFLHILPHPAPIVGRIVSK